MSKAVSSFTILWLCLLAGEPHFFARAETSPTGSWPPQPLQQAHLPNAYRIHAQVISGGQPDGEAGYRALRELGVQTIISVDGAQPPVELARQFGLRYVHLPHGYDGVPESRAVELAKAVRELPGPIYIHCHHGLHRSPAAAAVACVGAGLIPPEDAMGVLRVAGTSEHYRGLYESAAAARRVDRTRLAEVRSEFPERVKVPPMAESMVAIERSHDFLNILRQAAWQTPASHPDLDAAHEALLLREHFTELLRTDSVQKKSHEFQERLRDSEQAAVQLEAALREPSAARRGLQHPADELFDRLTNQCQACHNRFRDIPLQPKQSFLRR